MKKIILVAAALTAMCFNAQAMDIKIGQELNITDLSVLTISSPDHKLEDGMFVTIEGAKRLDLETVELEVKIFLTGPDKHSIRALDPDRNFDETYKILVSPKDSLNEVPGIRVVQ